TLDGRFGGARSTEERTSAADNRKDETGHDRERVPGRDREGFAAVLQVANAVGDLNHIRRVRPRVRPRRNFRPTYRTLTSRVTRLFSSRPVLPAMGLRLP